MHIYVQKYVIRKADGSKSHYGVSIHATPEEREAFRATDLSAGVDQSLCEGDTIVPNGELDAVMDAATYENHIKNNSLCTILKGMMT